MLERRLTVLVDANGSVEILPSRTDQPTGHRWPALILLCVSFVVGTTLSLSALLGLLFTSGKPVTLRPSCLQWLTFATLLDTVQGHLFGAAFIARRPADSSNSRHIWPSDGRHVWCSVSAALSLWLLLAQAAYLAALALQVNSEPRSKLWRRWWAEVLPLLIGLTVAVQGFCWSPVHYFPQRNGCGFVNTSRSTVWQPHTLLALITISASCLIIIYGLFAQQKHPTLSSKPHRKTDKTVLKTLAGLFVLLVMPYSALTIATNFTNSYNVDTGVSFETLITWLRYLFNTFLPIVVLFCYKEVRKEGKCSLFWFRKSNAVQECSCTNVEHSTKLNISSRKPHGRKKGNPEIPVLFTTAKGLYLRTVLNTSKSSVLGSENFTDEEKTILCEPCDFSELDGSRAPSRCLSFRSSNAMTPDVTKDSTVVNESSAAKRRNVVRFSEEVTELPAASESGVWSDPLEEMGTKTVKSSMGSTYTKSK